MNKHLHRIVFNAARGTRMVVQETARSASKAASGTTLAVAVLTSWAAAPAGAQVAADPNAPGRQRPTVLATPEGAPLVNIQTPSAAGVSRNLYRQFDVDGKGAVLNNSRTAVQTRLAGHVPGNPWLAQGPARIILNEVNSADPSRLRGYVEVAGQRAEVIIANPAGIQVDGAGFINASRATLTTGTAQFGADGGLAGFLVRGGTIRIEGAGLDASTTDYAAILSRALQVNAGIWASELKVVVGSGEVAADSGGAQPAQGQGTAPVFALDVAALGGMYAGKITLIGTEAGVGVRNAGHIGAGVGGLVVTAAGRLENTGTLEGGRVELASGEDIHNRGGQIRQAGAMGLDLAAAAIRNSGGGQIGAPAPAAAVPTPAEPPAPGPGIEAAAPAAPGAMSPSDPAPTAPPAATGPGSLRATGTLHNEGGRILASGTIALQAPQIDNGGGTLHLDRMDFTGERFSNAGGTLQVRGDFSARTTNFDNTGGQLAAGRLDIASGGRIDNAGGVLASAGTALLSAGGLLDNGDGSITAAGTLDVKASALHNRGALRSDNALTLAVDGALANNGSISAAGPLQVTAGTLRQQADGVLAAGLLADSRRDSTASLHLHTREALDNRGGALEAGRIAIDAGALANTDGGRMLHLGADSARIAVAGTLDNTGGRILAEGQDLALQAARIVNGGGRIDHAGTGSLDITATQLDGGDGAIRSSGRLALSAREATHAGSMQAHALQIDAGQLINRGEIVQTGTAAMRIAATQRLDNAGGRMAGNATDMSLQANTLDNTGGRIEHAGSGQLLLQAERLDGNAGRIVGNGALQVQAAQIAHGAGASMAAEHIAIDAARLANTGGEITQRGEQALRIDATEALDNTGGRIAANAQDMRLQSAHLTNAGGRIEHAGHGQLAIAATRVDGGSGSIVGNGTLALQADTVAQAGSLQASHIDIAARVLDNRGGRIVQTGDQAMRIAATERLDNRGGHIAGSARDLDLAVGTLDNGAGRIEHAGQGLLAIAAARLDGNAGHIIGNGALRIQAGQIAHGHGASMAAEQIAIDTGRLANDSGEIVQRGNQAMRIAATDALDNTGGRIAGNGQDMALQSAHLTNAGGRVEHAGGGALTITADRLDGGSGSIVGNGALVLRADAAALAGSLQARQIDIAARVLDNRGGRIVQTGDEAMRIVATERVDNSDGHIASNARDLRIEAALLANARGRIEHAGQGLLALQAGHLDGNAGRVVGNGALQVGAERITHGSGASMVAAQVAIATRQLANTGGEIVQTGNQAMRIEVDTLLDNTGGRIAGNAQDMALQSARIANAGGRIEHAGTGTLAVDATELAGGDGHIVGNSVLRLRADRATLAGSLQAAQVDVAVGTLDNTGEIVQTGSGTMQLTATGRLGNQGGRIAGNATDLHLQAATLDNTGGTIEHAGSGLLRLAAERIDGNAGRIVGNGALQMAATQIAHGGGAHMAAGQITIDTARLANTGGEIVQRSAQAMRITATASLDNTGGRIAGHAQDMALQSARITNEGGRIEHAGSGQLSIDASQVDGGNGNIVGNGALVLRADTVAQAGSLQAHAIDIVARTLDNRGGHIVQTGDAAMHIVATERLDNAGGQIAGNAVDLSLRTATLDNTGGSVEHAGNGLLALQAGRLDGNAGRIVSNGALRVEAEQITHGTGASMAAEHIAIATARLTNTGGEIVQRGQQAMQIDATEALDNTGGRIAGSGQDMALQSAHLANAGGHIEHAGNGNLSITTTRLDGGDGSIVGNGALSLHADTVVHAGSLQADQVAIDTRTLDNRGGRIVQTGGEAMRIAATAQIDNRGGRIAGNARQMDIATATLANASGDIAHAGSGQLGITVGHLEGDDGRIVGNGALAVQAGSLVQHGTLQAHRITIDAGTLTNAGEIVHTGDATMRVSTTGLLDNRGGRIAGNGHDMVLQASHLMNANGRIEHAGTGTLTLTATQVDGGNGQVIGNGALALQADSLTHAGQMHTARLAIDAGQITNSGEIVHTWARWPRRSTRCRPAWGRVTASRHWPSNPAWPGCSRSARTRSSAPRSTGSRCRRPIPGGTTTARG
ncbi:filamentous hemagglutinin N-terminal domain-containing protein [Pseudorhodoferax sp. Leaf267]|uniref:two-partner secretion domain-containing protein n=1 Tax=Pseudorhodoferax sp. Leaf267 TaxID=1736316 RepID=UPI0006F8B1C9|nr:filamentous hemagglutinin N-terminal domain-containing protein [Pseudorhodoferax sp. Leaf267]KQP13044.1 hypothetical protein ASF43_18110 [Pseudorhodoferax sp. Leaf267]